MPAETPETPTGSGVKCTPVGRGELTAFRAFAVGFVFPAAKASLPAGSATQIASKATEAIRRRDEVRSGRVQAIPGGQVIAEVHRLVGR